MSTGTDSRPGEWPKGGEMMGGGDRVGLELGQVTSLPRWLVATEGPEGRSRAKEE